MSDALAMKVARAMCKYACPIYPCHECAPGSGALEMARDAIDAVRGAERQIATSHTECAGDGPSLSPLDSAAQALSLYRGEGSPFAATPATAIDAMTLAARRAQWRAQAAVVIVAFLQAWRPTHMDGQPATIAEAAIQGELARLRAWAAEDGNV